MKVLINQRSASIRYGNLIQNELGKLGVEVTFDPTDEDIDHLLMCNHTDGHDYLGRFPVYEACDKLTLVERSERSGLGVLSSISPTSDQEVIDFMLEHGDCIIKPRCGAGGTADTLPLFYHHFSDATVLLEYLDSQVGESFYFKEDWRVINAGQSDGSEGHHDHTLEFVLQDYRDMSEGTSNVQFYSRGFVGTTGRYIPEVLHTSDAEPCPVRAERDYNGSAESNAKGRQVYKKKNDQLGLREGMGLTEEGFNASVSRFIEGGVVDIPIRSNWLQLGGMIIDGKVYIFDVALSPSDLIKYQDPSRFASQAAWIYGLTEDEPILQNRDGTNTWYTGVTCDTGFTRANLISIADFGGQFIYPTSVGDEYALAVFVASSRENNEQNKTAYLATLGN